MAPKMENLKLLSEKLDISCARGPRLGEQPRGPPQLSPPLETDREKERESQLLSSLSLSRTGSASDWCSLQETLYKCIDTIQYNSRLRLSPRIRTVMEKVKWDSESWRRKPMLPSSSLP